jgi:hypothetical protein
LHPWRNGDVPREEMFANEARGEMNSFNEFLNTYYPIVKLHPPPEYIAPRIHLHPHPRIHLHPRRLLPLRTTPLRELHRVSIANRYHVPTVFHMDFGIADLEKGFLVEINQLGFVLHVIK